MCRRIPYLHRLHRNQGFSLIEVLVTLVLLGVGLLVVSQVFAAALGRRRHAARA